MAEGLTGKIAVVTGGARGIGLAVAERLASDGARVALWEADLVEAKSVAERLGGHAVACDVTDEAAVAAALASTEAALGPVDILVANAGITGPNLPVATYPVADWRRVIEVDLTGVFLCCQAVVPGMSKRGWGRIVNIASVAGKEGNPNAAAYSAAKAGVIGLTKSLGKELAQSGVLVNCVTPAAAKTAIFDQMTPEHIAYMLSKIPMGRFVEVAEIAGLVRWLAGPECGFSTGAVFDISGGRATY
ncbi:3-oxoacyl-[acyl-carrier protein] reductase [Humitalea rosea]|uniref:3-oxoacyl-[acyl-carrier protein] reductase n=1 Tax=Humitalea rosea TaxID=990373 RepID=A0A2W7IN51_9PROT|nr:SDR family NAD(P)-dependent oxidoreductase [Humitalea rosea]PZW48736.1 3-oxoacyl-[acyl-carrier protein] reductase [Humitalea rosea]